MFVELSDEEREILGKAERIVEEIWAEMIRTSSNGRPILDLFNENLCVPSCDKHDIIEVYKCLNALAVSNRTGLREYGVSSTDSERWDEICKYEENRR